MLRSEGFDEGEGGWERPRLVSTPESEGVKELDRRADRLEGETRVVAGVLNAGFGRLVEVAAEIIADPRGLVGCGVHTPAAWLAWHAGLSRGQGRNVERLARRVVELPDTVAALVAGELSLDQASVIARYVPANFEASACDVAKMCTVAQLRRTLPNYNYDADENPDQNPKDKADAERSMSCGTDGRSWWGRMRMPLDEGAAFEAAMAAKRDQLFKARQDQDGDDAVAVTNVDGLLAMAESALADLDARLPGTDRYIVNLHLEANPDTDDDPDADSSDDDADAAILWLHQRGAVDRATHRFLTCDCRIRAHLYKNGTPYSSGATRRLVNRPLRRQVEQRDKGCVIPGCAALRGLEVHHIRHWEDGGPTVSSNLVTVCRRHHRAHHHGHVNICGNPDLPTGTCGALEFADGNGKPMPPGPVPTPPEPGTDLAHAARTAGLPDATYISPLNERLDTRDFWLNPTPDPPPGAPGDAEPDDLPTTSAAPVGDWDHTDHHPPPGGTTDPNRSTDPTRAGPSAA